MESAAEGTAGSTHTHPSLLDQNQEEGEMNESDLRHFVLEMTTKVLHTDTQTHVSSYFSPHYSAN